LFLLTVCVASYPAPPSVETPKLALVAKPPGIPVRWSFPVFVSPPIIYFHDEFFEFSSSRSSYSSRSWQFSSSRSSYSSRSWL
jgi:hypothetical protein